MPAKYKILNFVIKKDKLIHILSTRLKFSIKIPSTSLQNYIRNRYLKK